MNTKHTHRPRIVGIGETLWDRLPHGDLLGGAPTNVAVHARQLGATSAVVSAVGDDEPGRRLLKALAGARLDTSHVQVNDSSTGSVDVSVTPTGEPTYVIHKDVAWDRIEWTESLGELAARADCVCVGSLAQRAPQSRATIQRFLASTRDNCLKLFDVNVRLPEPTADVIRTTMRAVNVVKLNESEWPFVAAMLGFDADPNRGCEAMLREYDLKLLALTRGGQGSVLITRDATSELPGTAVRVVDTVGAGDAFTAVLAMGILRGDPLDRLHRWASAVSAFVCTQHGATPTLPGMLKSPDRMLNVSVSRRVRKSSAGAGTGARRAGSNK